MCLMRVEFREIKFASKQGGYSADRAIPAVAARTPLDGLKQAIQGFNGAIGLATLRPSDDVCEVVSDHFSDFFHGIDLGAHDVGAPLPEHFGYNVDPFSIMGLAQLFTVNSGPRGALCGEFGQQRIDLGESGSVEPHIITQHRPAQSLEIGRGFLFEAQGLVQGLGGMGDHMELVESDPCTWQLHIPALDERGRHVDADRLDGINISAMGHKILGQATDRPGITALDEEQHGTSFWCGVDSQCYVIMSARTRGLVNGKAGDAGGVSLGQRNTHVALADRCYPMPDLADQTRHCCKRYLTGEHQYQRLEQQNEVRELAGPVRLHLAHYPTGQLHAQGANLQVASVSGRNSGAGSACSPGRAPGGRRALRSQRPGCPG